MVNPELRACEFGKENPSARRSEKKKRPDWAAPTKRAEHPRHHRGNAWMVNPELHACELRKEPPSARALPYSHRTRGEDVACLGRTHEASRAPTTPPGQSLDGEPGDARLRVL